VSRIEVAIGHFRRGQHLQANGPNLWKSFDKELHRQSDHLATKAHRFFLGLVAQSEVSLEALFGAKKLLADGTLPHFLALMNLHDVAMLLLESAELDVAFALEFVNSVLPNMPVDI
jgi:hypothetical protein